MLWNIKLKILGFEIIYLDNISDELANRSLKNAIAYYEIS